MSVPVEKINHQDTVTSNRGQNIKNCQNSKKKTSSGKTTRKNCQVILGKNPSARPTVLEIGLNLSKQKGVIKLNKALAIHPKH